MYSALIIPYIGECGYTNLGIKRIANGADIDEEVFLKLNDFIWKPSLK